MHHRGASTQANSCGLNIARPSADSAWNIMPPHVSVITVNYNQRGGLEKTIASVLAQSWPGLEYLVIDGGSTDGSADLIRANHDHISYWVSERDRGLYDAMNKGVKAAKGDWILFMNSDDIFVDN